jgi:hypothetical protein
MLNHNIIAHCQSGFTKGDSAINQLVNITNNIGKALDDGKEFRIVFCDVSKAFDKVWHRGLLHQLTNSGFGGNIIIWLEHYLQYRFERVAINGCYSSWQYINAGVPQGSILDPLLFLLYINDIVGNIQSQVRLFADDTSIFLIVDNAIESADIFNRDLNTITSWSNKGNNKITEPRTILQRETQNSQVYKQTKSVNKCLVSFNSQKTETMVISRKVNKPHHPLLVMNNQKFGRCEIS